MPHLPVEVGLVDQILDAIVDLLTAKLQAEVPDQDVSRLVTVKVGPRQDDPSAIVALLHENDPGNPTQWPHCPLRFPDQSPSFGGMQFLPGEPGVTRMPSKSMFELVGGGSMIARCFTLEIEVWGDEVAGLSLERRDVGQVAAVVEHRCLKILKEAGAKIGLDSPPSDDFGETVSQGPFWGDAWTDQEEGEALIVRKYIRFYYKCMQSWSTDAW